MSWIGDIAGGLTGSTGLWIAGGAAVMALGAIGTQTYRLHTEQAEHATDRATFATREAELQKRAGDAERLQRQIEARRESDLQRISDASQARIDAVAAAASAAVSSALSLRDAAKAAAARGRRACSNPSLAGDGPPAPDALSVFADVLGRADARAGDLASIADQRGARGEACERAFEALRK